MCRPTDVLVPGGPAIAGAPIQFHHGQQLAAMQCPAGGHCPHSLGLPLPAPALSFTDRYVPIESVGVGSTASVTLAIDVLTKQKVALKAVRKSKMSRRKILQEISVHAGVSAHPNIATLFDAHEMDDTYTLVEEYMPNGDMFEVIEPDHGMPEAKARDYALQIASAIEYIHRQGFVHRDIKPENVCLAADNTCRLIDFGHAAHQADCKQDDYVGTVPYMAYELLNGDRRHVDFRQSDVWAFGATVFVMCTGKFPWREATPDDKEFAHFAAGGAGPCHKQRWASFSPALNHLLRNTMCVDTRRRWTMTQAREFIQEHWIVEQPDRTRSPSLVASPMSSPEPIYPTPEGTPRPQPASCTLQHASGASAPGNSGKSQLFMGLRNMWRPHVS